MKAWLGRIQAGGRQLAVAVSRNSRFVVCCLSLVWLFPVCAELPEWWKSVHNYDGVSDYSRYMTYTSANFGPNALPVPELSDAKLATNHQVEVTSDVFWGFGDQTQSLSTRLTYLFMPGKLAVSAWGVLAEHYKTTQAVRDQRASLVESAEETFLVGDFYLATHIGLLQASTWKPDVVMDVILKTAASKTSAGARYFDTPGYIFRLNAGKSWLPTTGCIDEIRLAGNLGFLCYQLNSHLQNDAPLYGALLQLRHGPLLWEAGGSGYSGWSTGDKPLVLRSKFSYQLGSCRYFISYQHAVRDYPFRRIQSGINIDL